MGAEGSSSDSLQGTHNATAGFVFSLGQPKKVFIHQHQVAGHVHHHLHQLREGGICYQGQGWYLGLSMCEA